MSQPAWTNLADEPKTPIPTEGQGVLSQVALPLVGPKPVDDPRADWGRVAVGAPVEPDGTGDRDAEQNDGDVPRGRIRREARFGVAALLSFLILVGVLIVNRVRGGKSAKPNVAATSQTGRHPSVAQIAPGKLAAAEPKNNLNAHALAHAQTTSTPATPPPPAGTAENATPTPQPRTDQAETIASHDDAQTLTPDPVPVLPATEGVDAQNEDVMKADGPTPNPVDPHGGPEIETTAGVASLEPPANPAAPPSGNAAVPDLPPAPPGSLDLPAPAPAPAPTSNGPAANPSPQHAEPGTTSAEGANSNPAHAATPAASTAIEAPTPAPTTGNGVAATTNEPPASVEPTPTPAPQPPSTTPGATPASNGTGGETLSAPPVTATEPANTPSPATPETPNPSAPRAEADGPKATLEPIPTPTPTPTPTPAGAGLPLPLSPTPASEPEPAAANIPANTTAMDQEKDKDKDKDKESEARDAWVELPNLGKNRPLDDDLLTRVPTPDAAQSERNGDGEHNPDPAQADGGDQEGRDRVDPVPHVVQRGENFWTISRLYYGYGRFWKALWWANRATVPDPKTLYVGTVIRIPPPEALDRSRIEPARASTSSTATATATSGSTPAPTSSRSSALRKASRPIGGEAAEHVASAKGDAVEVDLPTSDPFSRHAARGAADDGDDDPERSKRPLYKVRPYETLRSIARDALNDSRRADEILELNADVIDDPTHLITGQILQLPEDARVGVRLCRRGRTLEEPLKTRRRVRSHPIHATSLVEKKMAVVSTPGYS